MALLGAWSAWFFLAQVAVYATSIDARLEVAHEVHPVESEVTGTVSATHLELGAEVEAGQVLVELDRRATQLELDEQRTRLEALTSQLPALEAEIEAEREVLEAERNTSTAALAEARAREREAKAMESFTREKATRWEKLASDGVVSGVDHLEAKATADQRQRGVEALRLGVKRLQSERRTRMAEQNALIDRLEREGAQVQGEIASVRAAIERLEHELERHLIRAPISGRLGEISPLRIGSVVSADERLASIVPEGEVRAVAVFTPAEATGRLRPGQSARIRLDGFPWTQYGSLSAEVTSVASEPQGGLVRVELDIDRSPSTAIPLEHGLPGTAEVLVERASPAILVLRAAGRLVSGRRPGAGGLERGAGGRGQEA